MLSPGDPITATSYISPGSWNTVTHSLLAKPYDGSALAAAAAPHRVAPQPQPILRSMPGHTNPLHKPATYGSHDE